MTRQTVGMCPLCGTDYARPEYASLLAEALAVLAERDALAAAVARVETLATEWESRVTFDAACLDKHPDDFWRGMATKGWECVGDVRRALDGGES